MVEEMRHFPKKKVMYHGLADGSFLAPPYGSILNTSIAKTAPIRAFTIRRTRELRVINNLDVPRLTNL